MMSHNQNSNHCRDSCPISGGPCVGSCIYADIMQNVYLGIAVLDSENKRIVFRNNLFALMFEWADTPNSYEKLAALLPDIDEFLTNFPNEYRGKVQLDKRTVGYTAYHITKNFISFFMRDITDYLRLESIAEAVNNMNNIGYICSGIRHEIGNPLNSIKITLSVLKRNIDEYPKETVLEYVDRTLSEITRIEYLLKTLKNFNMYETPYMQDVHLPSFFDKFLTLVKNDFSASGIAITTNINPESEWVHADPRALQQILLNILTNAFDALGDQSEPAVTINITPTSKHVAIDITDNGYGMTDDEKENLFRPFFTNKPNGTGLGMVIVKKMLAKIGGFIDVESEKDVGTKVHLRLESPNAGRSTKD